jgi:tol-pal system protein YbgF
MDGMSRQLSPRYRAVRTALRFSVLALGATALLAVPAAAQSRREMQMMADIRMLQEQTQQMQQQLQVALDAINAQLKAISTRVDDQAGATRKSFADQKLAVDQFGSDLRIVRERIDESNVRITSLSQEVEALRLAIPEMGATPGAPGPPAEPGSTPPVSDVQAPSAPAPPPTMSPGISPQRLFSTALSDFTAGQWTLCIEGFSTYLKGFSRTDAADDAQWYIGECYYSDGKFPEAIDSYNRVITSYPKGDRVPDAYYKLGVALNSQKQPEKAREAWETVIKQFPNHELAALARQSIIRVFPGKPPGR